MTTLVIILAMLLVSGAVGLWLLRRLVRRARAGLAEVREQAGLAVRAHAPGPQGEVVRLRREMNRSVVGARRALRAARAVDAPEGDVAALLSRLELAAHQVDAELRMLEAEPDRQRLRAALDGPRSRARVVISSAGDLVDALLLGASRGATDLSLLQAECAIEADALRGDADRWPHPVREPGRHPGSA
jgi:hypothetical protein